MSFLTLRTPIARPLMLTSSRNLPVAASLSRYAGFHTSRARSALSEDNRHQEDGEAHASEVEKHKQDSLSNQKEGKGSWKPELASNSEASIKADRDDIKASDENIKKMQEEAAKIAKS